MPSCKKKFQPWADLAAVYGIGILNFPGAPRCDYECLWGLWLCLTREETRRAYDALRGVMDGIGVAMGGAPIPPEYFLAITETAEEGQAIHAIHADRVRCAMVK